MTKYERLEKTRIKFQAKLIGAEQKKDSNMIVFWKNAITGIDEKIKKLTVEEAGEDCEQS